MLGHPPEWNPLQITQKQRRIAHRRETAAHIRDDENEEHDMVRRNSIFVHPQPWPNQQHRRSGRAEHVRKQRAHHQETHVLNRRCFSSHRHVYPSRNDIQRPDQRDKADVLVRGMKHRHSRARGKPQAIIRDRDQAQRNRNLRIMPQPPRWKKQWPQRDHHQQRCKRQHHPWRGLVRHGAQASNVALTPQPKLPCSCSCSCSSFLLLLDLPTTLFYWNYCSATFSLIVYEPLVPIRRLMRSKLPPLLCVSLALALLGLSAVSRIPTARAGAASIRGGLFVDRGPWVGAVTATSAVVKVRLAA